MRKCLITLVFVPTMAFGLTLARDGKSTARIVVSESATPAERHAADELALFLGRMTGGRFVANQPPEVPGDTDASARILVGPDAAGNIGGDEAGPETLIIRTRGNDLILTGGRPRGTLYAVYEFLHRQGCRWWTPQASTIPRKPTLEVGPLDIRLTPRFEYREPFWFDAFDGDWAVRNRANGATERLDEQHGGKHVWEGFVHTFFPLVPPERYFKDHPEWYSEIDGRRQHERAQLCLTNDELRAELVRNLKARLRANPAATIASVSQNDWAGWCRCAKCAAVDEEEGSHAGTMLRFVNRIAEEIEGEFPNVAICTLAYQYTRKPPLKVRPRANVIVQLCSIECSFRRPLTDDVNQAFRDDLLGWSKICNRLYIWDYTTNFRHYLLPHPNLRVLGPNIRFFSENGVKGVFEQGAYQSSGAEMADLRAWVLGRLLWDPTQDAAAVIDEFIDGYYGPAAPHIRQWLDLTHQRVAETGDYLGCFSGSDAAFLSLDTLSHGATLMKQAMAAVGPDEELQRRVRLARLPILYTFLIRWPAFRTQAQAAGTPWPVPSTARALWEQLRNEAAALNVTMASEHLKTEALAEYAGQPDRRPAPPPPECSGRPADEWSDVQDYDLELRGRDLASLIADPKASDGAAARMPGTHGEWAVAKWLRLKPVETHPEAMFHVKLAIRCTVRTREGTAFRCGIWENRAARPVAELAVPAADVPDDEYHVYDLGAHPLVTWMYVWVAPPKGENVEAVYVDRIWIVKK